MRYLTAVVAALAALALAPAPALADPPAPAPDRAELEEFFDELVPRLLKQQHVPGTAVTVVRGSGPVFAAGYGYADVARRTPVDPERTVFRTASLGKSFTAAAVLRLAEQGRVALDADVNRYLPAAARIPDTYPGRPVTLHHLLSHSSGFADVGRGATAAGPRGVLPLGRHVAVHRPDRVAAPGVRVSYSNYNYDLAGYVVERVTGTRFDRHLDRELFGPLGMAHSGFRQPGEAARRWPVTRYYGADPGTELPVTYGQGGPSGATGYATVADLGRFASALLAGDGGPGGGRVPGHQMMRRYAGNHPDLAGAGYGVWQVDGAGPAAYQCAGDDGGAHNQYVVVPSLDLGIVVASNGDGTPTDYASLVRQLVVRAFLTRYAGSTPWPRPAPSRTDLSRYAGDYVTTRHASGEPIELFQTVFDRVVVTAPGDGTLRTSRAGMPEQRWLPAPGGGFVSDDGQDRMAFRTARGEVSGLAFGSGPWQAYRPTPWYATPGVLLPLAGIALLVLLSALFWPLSARSTPRRRGAFPLAVTLLTLCAGELGILVYAAANPLALEHASGLELLPLLLAVPVAAGVAGYAALAWRRGWWRRTARVHYTAVAGAGAVFLGVAAHYGLLALP